MSPVTMSKTPAVFPLDTKQMCYYSEAMVAWYYGSIVSAVSSTTWVKGCSLHFIYARAVVLGILVRPIGLND